MSNDYYDNFLAGEDLNTEQEDNKVDKGLEWINLHLTAKEAYQAINDLKKVKLRYISGHSSEKSYKTKSPWTISKAEVARRVGKSSQPLFNSNTFSKGLLGYFNETNKALLNAKTKKLTKANKGMQHKTKEELKESTIKLTKENKLLLQNTCEELYEKLLSELPLDVKRKLGLN
ncbi:MAG: hypothetical protein MK137_09325 [Rickettsiales bacterium]|uniref:Uncharacterized protein n=1 Tax=Thalassotalea algicola TaxID=2716224 RepID=A0A7Y0Q8Z8_9GAMM|nr:hypothetical protein [Thalassotalea algicola]MCH2038777.1 hypothetical protein [Rickettsiales bacterium]NMP32675.1 hypothetical protein [Thalassotalea algicola]